MFAAPLTPPIDAMFTIAPPFPPTAMAAPTTESTWNAPRTLTAITRRGVVEWVAVDRREPALVAGVVDQAGRNPGGSHAFVDGPAHRVGVGHVEDR